MDSKTVWIIVAVVAVLIVIGLAAGWAWTAGAAAAGAAAAAKMAAENKARAKSRATVVEVQEDTAEAQETVEGLTADIEAGTLVIKKEISNMTPKEKVAFLKEVLKKQEENK